MPSPAGPIDAASRLAEQAVDALLELLGGFQAADPDSLAREEPRHIHDGLVTVLLRLVVLLHAEDRGLLPGDDTITGLASRLRGRPAPDENDHAWPALLARFHQVHAAHGGRLFDPATYPFLARPTPIPDRVLARVLDALLRLDDEPIAYRDLDLEHLGAVHEALLGFTLERAPADLRTIPGRKQGPRTPTLVPAGAFHLRPGHERRKSGAHYTPRSLTGPIVRTALAPLFITLGERPTPAQILGLKLCDPAMGSGAFLLEATRQLAEALRSAWARHELTPPIPDDEHHAARLVAQACVHGVDRDPLAVELTKLGLWLATAAKHHPFTFLDHALKHGDSLVGLDERWIDLDERPDPRLLADAQIHAHFAGDSAKKRHQRRKTIVDTTIKARAGDIAALHRLQRLGAELRAGDRPITPFHWPLEFPAVYHRDNPGFDCFVGNPPFLGGTRLSTIAGMVYFEWLLARHPGTHHLCDLVAHFLRLAFANLREGGTLGFVATNTVAQGDTRLGGLAWIAAHGGVLYAAQRRLRWPGSAAVIVSIVHIHKGPTDIPRTLDGRPVAHISSYLLDSAHDDTPRRLPGAAQRFSLGSKIYGQGFLFADDDPGATPLAAMRALLRREPRCQARIFPYIGGHELNQSPTQAPARHVIYLSDLGSEAELDEWPALAAIVRARVKPERDRLGTNPNNTPLRRRWWAYQAHRPALYAAIRDLPRVLVLSRVSRTLAFTFLPPNYVYSEQLVVFTLDRFAAFTILQSRVHEVWARSFSSSLKDDLRYTPSDCFETFPFPRDWQQDPTLESIGAHYHGLRAELMLRRDEGLTTTYNRFHDPDERAPELLALREHHAALDRAVLTAYGWTDLAARAACEFRLEHADDTSTARRRPWRLRWPQALHDEVLARLLALNRQRAAGDPDGDDPPALRRNSG
jgi:hypothetical protein